MRSSASPSSRSRLLCSVVLVALASALTVAAGEARADVAPPPTSSSSSGGSDCGSTQIIAPCDGKKSGDACTLSSGAAGTCTALRCVSDSGQTLLGCATASSSSSGGSSGSSSDGGCSTTNAGAPAGAMFAVAVAIGASLFGRRRRAR